MARTRYSPRKLKKILDDALKQGLIKPNTLADIKRQAYGQNTRIKIYPRDHKRYAFACRHRKETNPMGGLRAWLWNWNGVKVHLCRACCVKRRQGAMLVPPAPKGKAKAAGAGQ